MPFKKGHKLATGRKKGSENDVTKQMKSVKETVLATFHELQKDPQANLMKWGRENTTEFYKIAAKLIPTDLKADITSNGETLRNWTINVESNNTIKPLLPSSTPIK